MPGSTIQYLRRDQVNTDLWDQCIASSGHGLIYNRSWVLDIMCPGWDALVQGNYEVVMPLTAGKKYGFSYLYQPFLLAQTGITAADGLPVQADMFIEAIPAQFRLIDIHLNEYNRLTGYAGKVTTRVNMLISLHPAHAALRNGYHRLANRMIGKAQQAGIVMDTDTPVAEILAFYRQHYGYLFEGFAGSNENTLQLFQEGVKRQHVLALTARLQGRIVGVYLLLYDGRYVYSVLGGTSPEGKKEGAFYLLTNEALRYFAASPRVFRFEGSDKQGIAQFNNQFGPSVAHYSQLIINRLPAVVRWMK